MLRIYARRIITSMAHMKAFWYFTIENQKRRSMCIVFSFNTIETTIPPFRTRAWPLNTLVGFHNRDKTSKTLQQSTFWF